MSIEETYEWAKKMREQFEEKAADDPSLGSLNKEISQGGDHPVQAVQFVQTDRPSYRGEVGKVDGDLIFHFFPSTNESYSDMVRDEEGNPVWQFMPSFKDALALAFLDIFKHVDKLFWDFVPELNSWVVRAKGYGDNIMAEEMAMKLFDALQRRLEE